MHSYLQNGLRTVRQASACKSPRLCSRFRYPGCAFGEIGPVCACAAGIHSCISPFYVSSPPHLALLRLLSENIKQLLTDEVIDMQAVLKLNLDPLWQEQYEGSSLLETVCSICTSQRVMRSSCCRPLATHAHLPPQMFTSNELKDKVLYGELSPSTLQAPLPMHVSKEFLATCVCACLIAVTMPSLSMEHHQ